MYAPRGCDDIPNWLLGVLAVAIFLIFLASALAYL